MAKECALVAAVGNEAPCPRARCAFWEPGGAVVDPGCAIERLGLDLTNEQLAHYLLDLRRAIEGAHDAQISATARRELSLLASE